MKGPGILLQPRIMLMLLLVVVCAFAYHTLTNITRTDIVAYHQLDRQAVGASFASAGDIVAVSPDGQRMEAICLFELDPAVRRRVGIDSVYVNDLGRQLPTFSKLMAFMVGLGDGAEAVPDSVSFRGSYSELAAASSVAPAMTENCECEMARRLNRRERICTAIAALAEDPDGRAHAIRFATYSNFVPEEVYARCGLERSPAAMALEGQTCPTKVEIPWDVKLRTALRLIEERPAAARSASVE